MITKTNMIIESKQNVNEIALTFVIIVTLNNLDFSSIFKMKCLLKGFEFESLFELAKEIITNQVGTCYNQKRPLTTQQDTINK